MGSAVGRLGGGDWSPDEPAGARAEIAGEPAAVRMVDSDGGPLVGVRVAPAWESLYYGEKLPIFSLEWRSRTSLPVQVLTIIQKNTIDDAATAARWVSKKLADLGLAQMNGGKELHALNP